MLDHVRSAVNDGGIHRGQEEIANWSDNAISDEPKPSNVVRIGRPPTSRNGNGSMRVSVPMPGSATQEERRANLKYALFFLAVAVLLIVAGQLSKDPSATSGQSTSTLNMQFDLSIQQALGEVARNGYKSESGGYVVRFRLSNRGNHPVFYPARPGTNVLVGHMASFLMQSVVCCGTLIKEKRLDFSRKACTCYVPENRNFRVLSVLCGKGFL